MFLRYYALSKSQLVSDQSLIIDLVTFYLQSVWFSSDQTVLVLHVYYSSKAIFLRQAEDTDNYFIEQLYSISYCRQNIFSLILVNMGISIPMLVKFIDNEAWTSLYWWCIYSMIFRLLTKPSSVYPNNSKSNLNLW